MLSLADRPGIRLNAWNTKPTSRRRSLVTVASLDSEISTPARRMLPGVRTVQAREELEQRGLAGAGLADDGGDLAERRLEVDAVDGGDPAAVGREERLHQSRATTGEVSMIAVSCAGGAVPVMGPSSGRRPSSEHQRLPLKSPNARPRSGTRTNRDQPHVCERDRDHTRALEGEFMTRISLTVDGAKVADDVEPRMLLVQYLREKVGKTGTVIGCAPATAAPAPCTSTVAA